MFHGAPPLSLSESSLKELRIHVIVSQRMNLGAEWNYELMSPFWRIYVNNRPGAHVISGSVKLELEPGVLYLIPAWLPFQTGSSGNSQQDYIHFDWVGFPAGLHRRSFRQIQALRLNGTLESVCEAWQRSMEQAEREVWIELARAHAVAYTAMAQALEASEGWAEPLELLRCSTQLWPAIECIEQRFTPPPTNTELAELCACAPDVLIRRFRKALGVTPAQFGLERRLGAAARWLSESALSLEQIAEAAGFTDRFHFSKAFKAKLGMPPAEYRRLHRGG